MNLLRNAVHLTLCQTCPTLFHLWIERSYMVEHLFVSTTREIMSQMLQTSSKHGLSKLRSARNSMSVPQTQPAKKM